MVTTDEKFAEVRNWKNIVYVSTDMYAVTGVTADGKVLVCGNVKESVKSFAASRKNAVIAKMINGDKVISLLIIVKKVILEHLKTKLSSIFTLYKVLYLMSFTKSILIFLKSVF